MLGLSRNSTGRTCSRGVRSIGSAAPWRLSSFVLIGLIVLLATSCKTAKTLTATEQHAAVSSDSSANLRQTEAASSRHEESLLMWTQPVKADTAQLEIPLQDVASLPPGASYHAKSGRANVRAYLKPQAEGGTGQMPTLIVEASCDSLQQLCLWYHNQSDSLQRQLDYMEIEMEKADLKADITSLERPPNGINIDLVIIIACIMTGILVMYLIKKKT